MRLTAILVSTVALAACNMGAQAEEGEAGSSGKMTQRSYQLSGFDAVGSAGSQDVIVTVGGQHSVRAEGDAEVLDRLDIRVEGGTLKIGHKKSKGWLNWERSRGTSRIFVTMPAIRSAAVAGSGDMKVDRAQGEAFEASVAGSGNIDVGQVQVGEAKFEIAGSGNIRAAGTAQKASVAIAGSGNVETGGVQAKTASVSIAGSGDVSVHASDTADISIAGSGNVDVGGTARCTINKRGSGDVRCSG